MSFKLLTPVRSVTIGADPEVFFCTEGRLVMPACGLVGGSKDAPVPVHKGALQEDNVMAEFNIDPALTSEEFVCNVNTVYEQLVGKAHDSGLLLAHRASAEFPMFLLEQHPQAMQFGCEPDFNGYTKRVNPTPDVHSNLRTCAGHIHIGFEAEIVDEDYMDMCGSVVGYLDWIVGLWTVLHDSDKVRRERYGKAGAFRPKPYGLEYRVPSNFWLRDDTLKSDIFNRTRLAYGLAQDKVEKPSDSRVIKAINTHDVAECATMLGRYAA